MKRLIFVLLCVPLLVFARAGGGGSGSSITHDGEHPLVHQATDIVVDTTNFDTNLSAADDNIQKSLDTLDELVAGGGSGDAVTVNGTGVDTTANFKDDTEIEWTLADGGAGGPDNVTADIVDDTLDFTEFSDTMTLDADTSLSFGSSGLTFVVANPNTDAFDINGTGAFANDLLHVHQHTGNPTGGNLIHAEGTDQDISPLVHISQVKADLTADVIGLQIEAVDNDDVNWIPLQIRDDSGGTPDTLFQIDYTGAVTTGIWGGTFTADIIKNTDIDWGTGAGQVGTADITEDTDKNFVTDAEATVIGNTSGSNSGDNTVATTGDAAVDFFGAGVDAVTDATTCTDIEGTLLSITAGTLNAVEAQTLAAVLALGADGNDVDQTSLGKLEGFDAGLYLDWDLDGVFDITSDGTLELHSADWDISTTGAITNATIEGEGGVISTGEGGGTKYLREDGDGTSSWQAVAGGAGAFSDAGDPVVLNTTTKDVVIGTGAVNTSKLTIDGDADQVQLTVQANAAQTDSIIIVENSGGTEIFSVETDGAIIVGGTAQSTITEGLVVNEGGGADADDDLRVETNTIASALVVDASDDSIQLAAHLESTKSLSRYGFYHAYQTTAPTNLSAGSFQLLDLDTVVVEDADYYSENAGTVTIQKDGLYMIHMKSDAAMTTGTREFAQAAVFVEAAQAVNSTVSMYTRETSGVEGTSGGSTFIVSLNATDTVDVRFDPDTTGVDPKDNGTTLTMEYIRDDS